MVSSHKIIVVSDLPSSPCVSSSFPGQCPQSTAATADLSAADTWGQALSSSDRAVSTRDVPSTPGAGDTTHHTRTHTPHTRVYVCVYNKTSSTLPSKVRYFKIILIKTENETKKNYLVFFNDLRGGKRNQASRP